ncbi:MAG: hypothetical protein RLZZ553_1086 [Verrucomicrobiota bacterium]|jgi:hypothetical protein
MQQGFGNNLRFCESLEMFEPENFQTSRNTWLYDLLSRNSVKKETDFVNPYAPSC